MTTVRHCDLAGPPRFCNRGARQFAERYGLSWSDFIADGVDAEVLRNIGDAMADELVRRAERREMKGMS